METHLPLQRDSVQDRSTRRVESEEVKNERNASLASPRPSDGSFAHPGHPYLHLRQMTRTFDTSNCKYCIVQLVCGSYEPLLQSSYHSICNAKLSNKSFAFLSWCVKFGYSRQFLKSGPFSRKLNRPKKASRPSILGGYPPTLTVILILIRLRLSAKNKAAWIAEGSQLVIRSRMYVTQGSAQQ